MIQDMSQSIKATLYERVSSPLFGAVVVSWSLWNYKFLMVLFSNLEITKKFDYLSVNFFHNFESVFWSGFYLPICSALAFLLIYPIPAKIVYENALTQQRNLKKIKLSIEDETPLTIEESRNIRRRMLNVENSFSDEIERKDNEIKQYKEIIKNLEDDLNTRQKSLSNLSPKIDVTQDHELNEKELLLIKEITNNNGRIIESELFNIAKLKTVEMNHYIEELIRKNFIQKEWSNNINTKRGYYISLTSKGNKYVVEKGIESAIDFSSLYDEPQTEE